MSPTECLDLSNNLKIPFRYLNRHGVVVGATGSGKTVTLMRLAEQAALAGISVIATDLKGDFRKIVGPEAVVSTRVIELGGDRGLRVPMREIGAEGFGRMIEANAVQLDAIYEVFDRVANLSTIEDFSRRLNDCVCSGDVPKTVAAAILRRARGVEKAADVFGRSQLPPTRETGLTVLDAVDLAEQEPRGYGVLMAHLLRIELSNPEVGDQDKPRRLFIIDEAHLLFDGLNVRGLQDITRTLRLIRSKGVGVWFASQSPQDLPAALLDQLGSRIVHALRPGPGLRAASSFLPGSPQEPGVIAALAPGEALAAVPRPSDGSLADVRRVKIAKPQSPLTGCRLLVKHPVRGAPYGGKEASEGDRFIGKTLAEVMGRPPNEGSSAIRAGAWSGDFPPPPTTGSGVKTGRVSPEPAPRRETIAEVDAKIMCGIVDAATCSSIVLASLFLADHLLVKRAILDGHDPTFIGNVSIVMGTVFGLGASTLYLLVQAKARLRKTMGV